MEDRLIIIYIMIHDEDGRETDIIPDKAILFSKIEEINYKDKYTYLNECYVSAKIKDDERICYYVNLNEFNKIHKIQLYVEGSAKQVKESD